MTSASFLEVTKIARLSLKLALSFVDRPASGFVAWQVMAIRKLTNAMKNWVCSNYTLLMYTYSIASIYVIFTNIYRKCR